MYKFQYSVNQHRVTITNTENKFGVHLESIGPRTAEFLNELINIANKANVKAVVSETVIARDWDLEAWKDL